MTFQDFKAIVDTIPHLPGVYRFVDSEGTILYVGKAKDLRNRLSNYFGDKKYIPYKTKALTKNANNIELTIVDNEHDALLLENTFIKKFQPRYNVSLKDGKSYSYIVIKKERFPRVFFTRKIWKDGSTYFGPYTSKARVKALMEVIKKMFPLRTCNLNLSESLITANKYKVCLEYHIKNCQGPCVGLEAEQDYNAKIEQIKNILKGNFAPVKEYLNNQMLKYADELQYELAQVQIDKLLFIEDYQSKSTVVNATIKDIDVFTIRCQADLAFVNYLKIVNGAVINTDTLEILRHMDEDESEVLSFAIPAIRERYGSTASEILSPYEVVLPESITLTLPQRGDKRKLLELSAKNLDYFLSQRRKQEINRTNKQTPAERILGTLRDDLQMKEMPLHIECFDNSNIQGTNPVASCVVFKNAKPSKKDYRKFNIKTVIGPNDFASMEEIVYRRYKRLIEEGESLPQLIIIDGGKGQLSFAIKSLEKLDILDKVTVIGIAKKLEEIYFPGDPIPLYINKKSESLKLIQQCRNEAHRFAITFHRDQRSKNFTKSTLTDIKGIGPKSAERLLQEFGSIKRLREAPVEDIIKIIGANGASKVANYLNDQLQEEE